MARPPCLPEPQENPPVPDTNPGDPSAARPSGEEPAVDALARLANLTSPPPGGSSIWRRREAAPEPVDAAPATEPVVAATDLHPAPFTAPSAGTIGRLSRVDATDLWPGAAAMAAWLAATPDVVAEQIGSAALQFSAPESNVLIGTDAKGGPVCVVCETGPASDEALGVMLRIAAHQDRGTVVWITGEPTDPHRAAVSWLNHSMPPRFYLLRVSGVRIDGSASAPVFDLVVRPPRTAAAGATGPDPAPPANGVTPQRRVEDHVPEA
jgi:hypothetical protein